MFYKFIASVGLLFCSLYSFEVSYAADLKVQNPQGRVTERNIGAGFMEIINESKVPVDIISGKAKDVGAVELHTHVHDNGIMRMRRVEKLTIPAQGTLRLERGGKHIMFFDVGDRPRDMKQIELKLQTSDGNEIYVIVPIKTNFYQKHNTHK